MLDKRDALIAKLARSLGFTDDAGIARATELKARAPDRSFDQLLVLAKAIDASQRQALIKAFNEKVRELKDAKSGSGSGRTQTPSRRASIAQERGIEDSGVIGLDSSEETGLPPPPPARAASSRRAPAPEPAEPALAPDDDDAMPGAFDAPPVPPPEVQRAAEKSAQQKSAASKYLEQGGPLELKSEGANIRNSDSDIQHVVEENPLTKKASASARASASSKASSDSGEDLAVPEDDDSTDEEKLLAEPTIIMNDDKPAKPELDLVPATADDKPALAEPPPSTADDDEKIELRSQSSSGRQGAPMPGVKSKKGGVLDREEFKRRTKMRLGFEGMTLGDYEILGEISRGAFGVVLKARPGGMAKTLARERGFEGDVAMKVMLETKDPEESRRFMDEVKVLISLNHPNIIRIFDAGSENGLTFYTMELVNGLDTRTVVRQQGPPPLLLSVRIAKDVAAALATVHAQTIYHRDIKPTNVMIDRSCQPYRTVLIDFGLVQKKGKDEGLVMGTPSYMPPEQAKPKGGFGEVNATSDIYALGATFYFLLTGQPPFGGNDAKKILKQVITEAPPDPCSINAEIPRKIADICLKCLAKVQRDRYVSAKLLEQDLEKELKSAQLKLKAKSVWGKIFGGGGGAKP